MSQTKNPCEPLVAVCLRPSTTEPCICCKQFAEKPRGEHLKMMYDIHTHTQICTDMHTNKQTNTSTHTHTYTHTHTHTHKQGQISDRQFNRCPSNF